ncbi:MAG: histidine phosphatase family protein [Actinomycetaceae bacterium]|nr:histidine phosphatase family protein [Actinomycetaceae bacterium]
MGQTLVLVRHAQAQYGGLRDDTRPLSLIGRDQSFKLGSKFKELLTGGLIVHSSARRASQTANIIARFSKAELLELPELYEADEYELLRAIPPVEGTVMVVGHAPSIPLAASLIASGEGPGLIASKGCPTATAYVFEVGDMAHLRPASADLKDVVITPGR